MQPSGKIRVLFDSGAYTAWRSGNPIDLQAYCRFLKENEDWIDHYAVLDEIDPGNPERAAEKSHENYKFMRKQGLRSIPIFHVGENIAWLEMMLDDGADYVGLSASSIITRGGVDKWYNHMWEHLCTPNGRPTVQTHAFGEGRMGSLMGGPWTSADTATWVYSAARAGVVRIGDQRLSHRKDNVSFKHAPDANGLDGHNKIKLHELLADAGVQADALERAKISREAAPLRLYLTARHYLNMQARVRAAQPIRYRPHGLHNPFSVSPAIDDAAFNFYLVCNNHPYTTTAAVMAGAESLLCSYAYITGNIAKDHVTMRKLRDVILRQPGALDAAPYANTHHILKSFLVKG